MIKLGIIERKTASSESMDQAAAIYSKMAEDLPRRIREFRQDKDANFRQSLKS